jgi:GNAT superfamily N-acetyltransferase
VSDAEEWIRLDLLLRHRLTPAGRLTPRPGSTLADVPRLIVSRHSTGAMTTVREDLPGGVADTLASLPPTTAFEEVARVWQLLGRTGTVSLETVHRFSGPAAVVGGSGVGRHGNHFVVLDGSRPVAWAWTIEEHGRAERGTVETVPEFRRRGHGRRALAAWARHVLERGKEAFVAHPAGEESSLGLLREVGAQAFATRATFQ